MCIPGTILGAFVSDIMTPVVFQILFALILVSSAVYIFVKRKITEKPYNLKNAMMIFAAAARILSIPPDNLDGMSKAPLRVAMQ